MKAAFQLHRASWSKSRACCICNTTANYSCEIGNSGGCASTERSTGIQASFNMLHRRCNVVACMMTSADAHCLLDTCRVTPKGCASVEGGTATKAWAALFNSQQSARALGFSGAKQFGLQHPRIQRMLQSLPEAAYCESYAGWLGPAPAVPPLVSLAPPPTHLLCRWPVLTFPTLQLPPLPLKHAVNAAEPA